MTLKDWTFSSTHISCYIRNKDNPHTVNINLCVLVVMLILIFKIYSIVACTCLAVKFLSKTTITNNYISTCFINVFGFLKLLLNIFYNYFDNVVHHDVHVCWLNFM